MRVGSQQKSVKVADAARGDGVKSDQPIPGKYRSRSDERMRELFKNPVSAGFALLLLTLVIAYPFIDQGLGFQKMIPVITILIYILLALGLNVVVGYAGLLDLGYAAFFAIGAYVAGFFTSPLSPLNKEGPQWYSNFWIAIVVAFFVAVLAGIILGAPTLRLRGDYLAIVTLGFGEIVPVVFRNADQYTQGERGLSSIGKPIIDIGLVNFRFEIGQDRVFELGDWSKVLPWYYLMLLIGAIAIIGLRRLQDSRLGRAWMAMREDEIAASAMGINLVTTKLSAFGMGASLSGAAGAVYGAFLGSITPRQFEFSTSVILLCAVILGGLGNMWGVILGGFLIQSFDRIFSLEFTNLLNNVGIPIKLSEWRFFIVGAALVIMMLVRPEGLLPSARRKAELRPEQDVGPSEGPGLSGPGLEPAVASSQARQTLYDVREDNQSLQEER